MCIKCVLNLLGKLKNLTFTYKDTENSSDHIRFQLLKQSRRFKLLVQFTYYFPTRQPLGFCTGVFFLVLS